MEEGEFDIKKHFENIGLWDKFPEKINRADLFSIQFHSFTSEQLYRQFLERLLHFDGACRFLKADNKHSHTLLGFKEKQRLKAKKNENISKVHPLDLSTAVFLCCDHIARQDLVLHFWGCKHAFPLIIKTEQLEPPILYIWPMKIIRLNTREIDEIPLTDCRFKTISAIRFGDQNVSKSYILNMVISKSEKIHSTFFHRNCEGSTDNLSLLCTGMIESMPVSDFDHAHVLFLNLRGNCMDSSNQTKFLLQCSDVLIVVCMKKEIDLIKTFVKKNERMISCKTIVIVLTDIGYDELDINMRKELNDPCKRIGVINKIIVYKETMMSEFRSKILKYINNIQGECTLKDLEERARLNRFSIDLDNICHTSNQADSFCDDVINQYKDNSYFNLFPLQGNECVEWSKADLDIYKLRHIESMPIRKYRERLEKNKEELRASQFKEIERGNIQITSKFARYLASSCEQFSIEIFLRSLKLQLDTVTCSDLQRLYSEYEHLLNYRQINQSNVNEIDKQLDNVEKQINSNSLSISSFFREMGQIYETISTFYVKESIYQIVDPKTLSSVAVKLLIHGYSIEIMDGRSNYVPINWIQSVLTELKLELKNVRIKVVTVLGIQSSGKSALLNVMFGSQFPVASGRCTRGVHMHLVKVSHDIKDTYLVDYFIIIDTEGLFSSEAVWDRLDERGQKERELATFVIGISHTTIINIMGEDIAYLKNLLPISVHAFLRMNLVGLNPKCKILHHNVDESRRETIVRHKTRALEKELDDQTRKACNIEAVQPMRFTDIIRFDISQDTNYFPPLFEMINGFEVINTAYGKKAMQLKDQLIADTKATGTLEELIDIVRYLWNAIRKETFVYEFRNTIETEAKICMDRVISNLNWLSGQEWQKLVTDYHTRISVCNNSEDLDCIRREYKNETSNLKKEQTKRNEKEFSARIRNRLVADMVTQLKNQSLETLKSIVKCFRKRFDSQIERDIKCRQTEIDISEGDRITLGKLDVFIHTHLDMRSSTKSMGTTEIENMTNDIFLEWCKEVRVENAQREHIDYDNDAYDCLYSHYVLHRHYIDEELETKSIGNRCMDEFLSEVPSCYWSSQVSFQIEKSIAGEVVVDVNRYMIYRVKEIKKMIAFYTKEIFVDLILVVKNHRHILESKLNTHKSFEIDLTLSLCGAFISRLTQIETDTVIMSSRLKENTERIFKSKFFEIIKSYRSITFEDSITIISEELCKNIGNVTIKQLAKVFAEKMRDSFTLLKTKQGLFYFCYFELLENDDMLPLYLNSPEVAIENSVCRKFDYFFGQLDGERENNFHTVIEENVRSNITLVCKKISEIDLSDCQTIERKSILTDCVEKLIIALESFLPVAELTMHTQGEVKNIDPKNFFECLILRLQEETMFKELLSSVEDIYIKNQYKKIKNETVQIIMDNFTGCREVCPFCREMCSNPQERHERHHIAPMHRPIGLKYSSSRMASTTCWEETKKTGTPDPLCEAWLFPVDESVEDNSFWKYMFATYVHRRAAQLGVDESVDVPESWKRLTKSQVLSKLNRMAKGVIET